MPRNPLPPPQVAVVNDQGIMDADWYDFFRELSREAITTITLTAVPAPPAVQTSWGVAVDAFSGENFLIAPSSNLPVTVGVPSNPVAGHILTFTVRNATGGAMGTVTWNAVFKLSAWTNPANGFSRSISFHYNGTNWIERSRTTVDIPN